MRLPCRHQQLKQRLDAPEVPRLSHSKLYQTRQPVLHHHPPLTILLSIARVYRPFVARVIEPPRVGGGTVLAGAFTYKVIGLSPRGRGNLPSAVPVKHLLRSIPRVGGGTMALICIHNSPAGLSPRVRGNPRHPWGAGLRRRSIPAWAGDLQPPAASSSGLSPRGRGNPGQVTLCHVVSRSIPAWAGEPARTAISGGPSRVYPRVGGGTRRTPESLG